MSIEGQISKREAAQVNRKDPQVVELRNQHFKTRSQHVLDMLSEETRSRCGLPDTSDLLFLDIQQAFASGDLSIVASQARRNRFKSPEGWADYESIRRVSHTIQEGNLQKKINEWKKVNVHNFSHFPEEDHGSVSDPYPNWLKRRRIALGELRARSH